MARALNGKNGKRASGLRIGQKAPDVPLRSDTGLEIRLSDYRGKKVIVYFYPKDNTPGCTQESCSFRDGLPKLKRKGAVILGVSTDSVASHKSFKEKYSLNFPLLSDPDRKMVHAFKIWKQKSLYGKKYMGLERSTFVINESGKIDKIFPKVTVEGHFEEVLASL